MTSRLWRCSVVLILTCLGAHAGDAGGNRLAYLAGSDPYYVSLKFPKLTTPQWVGEDGVDAIIILSIDDMRDPKNYETFLRPVLERLKQLDKRAALSIMTCQIDPQHPRLQDFLKDGISLESHTILHPHPLLQQNFQFAQDNYHGAVDLLNKIPNSRAVAYRMPYCDSLNTVSPRFFSELFNKVSPGGDFLALESSIFNIITPDDAELPRELVLQNDAERFRRYIPHANYSNSVENYPYPYVIGRLCWEFPCVVPSDWEGNNRFGKCSPQTMEDWRAALDATVLKRGVFTLVFHPHGWVTSTQLLEFIDYAAAKYGKRVKFLNFQDAATRLNQNLLAGHPLRATDGGDNGVRLADVNHDGYIDVLIGNDKLQRTRVWVPGKNQWSETEFPTAVVKTAAGKRQANGLHFGVLTADQHAALLEINAGAVRGWRFDGGKWQEDKALSVGLDLPQGADFNACLHDVDGDGRCELIAAAGQQSAIFAFNPDKGWNKLPFGLPPGATIAAAEGQDAGLRFVDIDGDGRDDVIFSNDERYSLHLFNSLEKGWDKTVFAAARVGEGLPPIVHAGANNGVWFHSQHLCVQNEQVKFGRIPFGELLRGNVTLPKGYSADNPPEALSPADWLKSLKARPGFVVEQLAHEPVVQDPIAFDWGADGKFWVLEMGDYPLGSDGKGQPAGRIKLLEDTNGDGKYDKATVFMDKIGFPTGILAWRKGVLITCAPDIFYAEDTNGDGIADKKEVLYTGFVEGNQQHRVNGLVRGLDNWIYCANGDSGGQIKSLKTGTLLDIRSRDVKLHPDDGGMQLLSGQTQFGRPRDDWDNWFGTSNETGTFHYALEDRYLRRNPHVAPPDTRMFFDKHPLFPLSTGVRPFSFTRRYTSACSSIAYRDDLFGPDFASSAFLSDPSHNLVHRLVLKPNGATFTAERAADEPDCEFLSSADNWFRPTTIRVGPDGALWVADIYRLVIEHPQWIPANIQKVIDVRAGADKGRIYRVYPEGKKPRALPRLDQLDTPGLVAALDHANGWQRDLAQELLVQRNDPAAIPLLEQLASGSNRAVARLHALYTLHGLNALKMELVLRATSDTHAGVRRHAVRLAEAFIAEPKVVEAVVRAAQDGDPFVSLQAAYTLGESSDERAGAMLGRMMVDDPRMDAAIFSSIGEKNLAAAVKSYLTSRPVRPSPNVLGRFLELSLVLKQPAVSNEILAALAVKPKEAEPWQLEYVAAFIDALERRGQTLNKFLSGPEHAGARSAVAELYLEARKLVAQDNALREAQLPAIRMLARGLDQHEQDLGLLTGLLGPQFDADVQNAAILALGQVRQPHVPEILLKGWRGYSARTRAQVLDVLFRREEWMKLTLDAIEAEKIKALDIDAPRRQRLLHHGNAEIKARAEKAFADTVNADVLKVLEAYKPALTLTGDAAQGAKLFMEKCSTCHQLSNTGFAVGPNLDSLTDNTPETLLIAILDPNRAVDPRYITYTAIAKDGRAFTGILAADSGNSVTLLEAGGKRQSVLRSDLKTLSSNALSLMPEGLQQGLQPQDFANLLAYIRAQKPKQ